MSNQFQPYFIFLPLGFAFLIFNYGFAGGVDEIALTAAFYAFFVGTAWTLIPRILGKKGLPWRHLLPPLFLMVILMLSVQLRTMAKTEVIMVTTMGLLHFRGAVLSFSLLGKRGKIFSILQVFSFGFAMIYLFQKNLFSFELTRTHFLSSMMMMGMVSVLILWQMQKLNKNHESSTSPSNHS